MLQNGTVINGVLIEKPHKFITACTIATQIILGVSSSQYGGCTITLSHLAPFVKDSFNQYLEKYLNWGLDEDKAQEYAILDTKKEIAAGVQTFNYQVNSMTNTNGQSPFLSVTMYLGETDKYKEELAMIIEEFLRQRILGFKNEKGIYITPAFPKLLYVLEEDNIHEDSKYWYLTELAAQCTAKRMVPDYISEKIMKENKINQFGDGDCYGCMRMQVIFNTLAYRKKYF
jgi:ribonucleoside-triphosphate reductase